MDKTRCGAKRCTWGDTWMECAVICRVCNPGQMSCRAIAQRSESNAGRRLTREVSEVTADQAERDLGQMCQRRAMMEQWAAEK